MGVAWTLRFHYRASNGWSFIPFLVRDHVLWHDDDVENIKEETHHHSTPQLEWWVEQKRVNMPCCSKCLLSAQHRRECPFTFYTVLKFSVLWKSAWSNKEDLSHRKTPQLRVKPLMFFIRKYQSWKHNSFTLSSAKFNTSIIQTHHPQNQKHLCLLPFCLQIHSNLCQISEREGQKKILLIYDKYWVTVNVKNRFLLYRLIIKWLFLML